MNRKLINLILSIAIFLPFIAAPIQAGAAAIDCTRTDLSAKEQIQCGACGASGATTCDPAPAPKTLGDTLKSIINIISIIGGAVAVIMIIVGGFRYVTSSGSPEATKSARSTIIYAIIGLVIMALAQIIVHFVLNNVSSA